MKKKTRNRRLDIRRETLHRLSNPELGRARGGFTCQCDTVSTPGCFCLNTNIGCEDTCGC